MGKLGDFKKMLESGYSDEEYWKMVSYNPENAREAKIENMYELTPENDFGLFSYLEEQLVLTSRGMWLNRFLKYSKIKPENVYIIGGFVAKSMNDYMRGKRKNAYRAPVEGDFDLLINDIDQEIDFTKIGEELKRIEIKRVDRSYQIWGPKEDDFDSGYLSKNRFGNLKWHDVDIVPVSNFVKKNDSFNIQKIINIFDLTTGAIMYQYNTDHSESKIYVHEKALISFENQEIEVLDKNILKEGREKCEVLMSRLIIQAKKFGYKIGDQTKKFIAENYDEKLDVEIKNYLEYKGYQENFEEIVGKLKKYKRLYRMERKKVILKKNLNRFL